MAGCLLMTFITVENLRTPALVMTSPAAPVARILQQLGWDQTSALLRHAAAEQTRLATTRWMEAQLPLALALLACLALATQKRVMPLVLCGIMLLVVLFQLRIGPELIYQGRETDFPPGSADAGALARYWALQQVYFGAEVVKLFCGGILGSYLFVFRASRRYKETLPPAAERRPLTRS